MSRIASGDVVYVKPSNNVYTALSAAALMVVIVGLVLFFRGISTITGEGLF